VLFADIVGFTPFAERATAERVVAVLDEVFSRFDAVVGRFGLEKIKTIGDAYLAVAGLPEPRADHAEAAAEAALAMRDECADCAGAPRLRSSFGSGCTAARSSRA
jgi:class 3 adenylate cyclase